MSETLNSVAFVRIHDVPAGCSRIMAEFLVMAAIEDSQRHVQVEDRPKLNDVQSIFIASLYLC